ncbi:Crp/Fnr family transcriptional regulator [Bacillus sp. HMF5848]|uniref:Crp/Fnr family transcriptional regulator n=1 Tax=Bacillus sp. HMF5848 TaxID=2495421 RepID=UPI000F780B85|nr:Crp/Fnr family transcriptional regulator [Bacillus sp. HMF5848]RSK27948.1 Crp/Fnr family transcriptional regulator [Bacillus sp. HMF5848]
MNELKPTSTIQLNELLKHADYITPLRKGKYIFQEGMDAHEVYIIRKGRVQISKITNDGKELCLRICQRDDIFGELTLFTDNPKYLLNSKVIEDGEAAVIYKENLERLLFENSQFAFEFMKWMSDHFRKTQTKFRDLLLMGKKGALYSTLIRLSNSYGTKKPDGIHINIPLTNQELANFCGTTRESINRMLNELRRNNILSINQGKITIHNLQYLKEEIKCEECPAEYCSIE